MSFKKENDVISMKSFDTQDFEIIWHNLAFTIPPSRTMFGRKVEGRRVLKGISGRVRSRQLVAIMGPSGAGKSTLLECITGHRSAGLAGEVSLRGAVDMARLKMAFIPQKDRFLSVLTVRECITFASKLQNSIRALHGTLDEVIDKSGHVHSSLNWKYHKAVVDGIIRRLGLESCADNRVSSCSGGQQKRLSIAQELVAKPSILILDEPTSGLDSATCLQVVELLNELTQGSEPIAVMATIHQPSVKTFDLFHKVYILSTKGKCIYDGSPGDLPGHFAKYGLEVPKLYNPADYAIEAATGEYGENVLEKLSRAHDSEFVGGYLEVITSDIPQRPVSELRATTVAHPVFRHIWYHAQRSLLMSFRDPLVFVMRFVSSFVVAAGIAFLFGPVGRSGGCPPSLDGDFEPSQLDDATEHIKKQLEDTYNNNGQQFFALLFMLFNSLMPTTMTFPLEIHVFIKEVNNGWYDVMPYYFGKTLAEIPFQLILPPIFVAITWIISEQVQHLWRYIQYSAFMIVIAFIGQSLGLIISAVYMNDLSAAIYLAPLSVIPFMIFSGIFVKLSAMPPVMRWLSWGCYLRFGIEGLLITLYGFERCGAGAEKKLLEAKEALIVWLGAMLGTFDEETTTVGALNGSSDYVAEGKPTIQFVENVVDNLAGKFISDRGTVQSSVLVYLDIYDWDIIRSWIGILVLLLVKRVIAYKVIAWRAYQNK